MNDSLEQNYPADLREILASRFDEEELRSLCFDLGVDYDSLRGEGKAGKARELVAYLRHRNLIPELIKVGRQHRPDIPWDNSSSPSFLSVQFTKYLDKLQPKILEAFRQDQYVMLAVEAVESEDSDTLVALQQALRSAFGIQVLEGTGGAGSREPLEEAIARHRLVALLGDPGIGKTTSLRSIALQQIDCARADSSELVPVWVSLGKWIDKEISAEEFIRHEFVESWGGEISQDVFKALLTQGKLMLLLDGLNELPQRELEKHSALPSQASARDDETQKRLFDPREDSLMALARESASRFMVSCRVLEYTHLPAWREFRILPLDARQIEIFIQGYLGRQGQRLEEILEQQPGLRNLVQIPFFLRSLIGLIQGNLEEIPTDRFQVVEFTCRAALHREAKRRGLNAEEVARVLGDASSDSMTDGWIGSWFNVLLKPDSKAAESERTRTLSLIDAMRCAEGAGLVIRTKEDAKQVAYRYLHQLVQEALALIYLQSVEFKDAEYSKVRSLTRMGEVHLHWSKLKEAQENFFRALELCPTVGAEAIRASILLNLSRVYLIWRRSREGLRHAEAAVQLLDRSGDTIQLAEVYHELGLLNKRLKKSREAEKYYKLSLKVYERLGKQSEYAYEIIYGLAGLYSSPMVYNIHEALRWYQKAIVVFQKLGDELGAACCYLQMAYAWRLWGEVDKACNLFSICVAEFERLQEPLFQEESLRYWSYMLRDAGRFSEALPILEKALLLAKETRSPIRQFRVLVFGLAWIASFQGKFHRAIELVEEALQLAKRQADPCLLADIYSYGLGYLVYLRKREFPKAAESFLLCDNAMDEEYRLHLSIIDRLGIKWAKVIGRYTKVNWLARMVSEVLWVLMIFYEPLHNPSHWFGRQLFRFGWWLHRF